MAILVGGGILAGALTSGYFSQQAANTAANAQNNATNVQQGIYNTQQANEAPYIAAGAGALGQIQSNMPSYNTPFSQAQFYANDPSYQFNLSQGQNAENRAAANSGGVGGASYLRDLGTFSQNTASQQYQNAFQMYQQQINNSFNRLASVAQIGQVGTGTAATTGTTAGGNIGQSTAQTGANIAAGQIGIGSAVNNGIGQGINTYQSQQLINAINARNGQTGGIAGIGSQGNPPGTSPPE